MINTTLNVPVGIANFRVAAASLVLDMLYVWSLVLHDISWANFTSNIADTFMAFLVTS